MRDIKNGLRVAVYLRVAQSEQCEESHMAMEHQCTELNRIIQHSDNIAVKHFWDYGSGLDYTRPGLHAALEAIKGGQADALLMKSEDRLGRDAEKNTKIIKALREAGGKIFFADRLCL